MTDQQKAVLAKVLEKATESGLIAKAIKSKSLDALRTQVGNLVVNETRVFRGMKDDAPLGVDEEVVNAVMEKQSAQ